jgi:GNAT superfamily N-acetyltransferase
LIRNWRSWDEAHNAVIIRAATLADAKAMADLREASIRALCSADHHDDTGAVEAWIGPVDKFVHLLQRPEAVLIVAEVDAALAGLAGFSGDSVTLNYVHPHFRFRGVSKALMREVEARLFAAGVTVGRLNSTVTALPFYRSIGWVETGAGSPDQGIPMQKRF